MEASLKSSEPARRRPRRRWLGYLAVLLAGSVGAYFVWETLFVPDDLRRLQGTWKSVRRFVVDKEEIVAMHWLVIDGRRITDMGADKGGRDSNPSYRLDIIPDRGELRVSQESMIQVFGNPVRLPIWLQRGDVVMVHYELIGSSLKLRRQFRDHDEVVEYIRESPE